MTYFQGTFQEQCETCLLVFFDGMQGCAGCLENAYICCVAQATNLFGI